MKKDTSQKKIEANRKNALKSTGPNTPKGKRRSSRNALKHGIFSQDAVIGIGSSKEDPAEYQQLLAGYREYLRPEGTPEGNLVETIVEVNWRKRRILRYETAEITRNVSSVRLQREIAKAERLNAKAPSFSSTANGLYMNMLETSWEQQYLEGSLDAAKRDLNLTALISDETMTFIEKYFGGFSQWYRRLSAFNDMARELLNAQDSPLSREDRGLTESYKYVMTGMIDKQREVIEGLIAAIEEDEAIEREVEFAQASMPSAEATDKILRYETTFHRQIYRAMSELDRLQRRRKGDIVPPTINVEVSNSG